MILDKVSYPKDLKNLSNEELTQLASEIRQVLITKLTKTGGHLAPNLGIVEATIALHYVFDCPKDKVVFDHTISDFIKGNFCSFKTDIDIKILIDILIDTNL